MRVWIISVEKGATQVTIVSFALEADHMVASVRLLCARIACWAWLGV